MTDTEKEQVITEVIQRLVKNKGLNLSINKMRATKNYFDVILNYVVHGEERQQRFGFVKYWFDPNDLSYSFHKGLQIPADLNDHQKVVLKLAYYFYNWYKGEYEQWTK